MLLSGVQATKSKKIFLNTWEKKREQFKADQINYAFLSSFFFSQVWGVGGGGGWT
jgi:hypothetical protein